LKPFINRAVFHYNNSLNDKRQSAKKEYFVKIIFCQKRII